MAKNYLVQNEDLGFEFICRVARYIYDSFEDSYLRRDYENAVYYYESHCFLFDFQLDNDLHPASIFKRRRLK